MGNTRENAYWEAEIPPSFKRPSENDRAGLEQFIRAKYEARRWVARNVRTASKTQEEKCLPIDKQQILTNKKEHRDYVSSERHHSYNGDASQAGNENDHSHARNVRDWEHAQSTHQSGPSKPCLNPSSPLSSFSSSMTKPSKSPKRPHHIPSALTTSAASVIGDVKSSVASNSKIDPTTELFNFLRIEDPAPLNNVASPSQADDKPWTTFHCKNDQMVDLKLGQSKMNKFSSCCHLM